jgi:hypothetical protein
MVHIDTTVLLIFNTNLLFLCTFTDLDSLHYGSPNLFLEGPTLLFWIGSRAARVKIMLSGTTNHLNRKRVSDDTVLPQTYYINCFN